MKEIMLWKINEDDGGEISIEGIENVNKTETEKQLEEVITKRPGLLMKDLKLIGRQTDTPGGPLDLLGVDGDGRLVLFELKRGTLTREAVAQIIDYASFLSDLSQEELSEHVSSRSGKLGIEKIDNFIAWYQEQFGKSYPEYQKPRMVLVGLGVDERTKRMVSFLSEGDMDIALTTFHGFKKGGEIFIARQVEVKAKTPRLTTTFSKMANLEKLKSKVQFLKIDGYYYEIASFFRDQLPNSYEWPNPDNSQKN